MISTSSRPDWMTDANCRGSDVEQFFQDTQVTPAAKEATARALWICRACDVQVECLTYALNIDELDGVWGGVTTSQRRRILRSPPKPTPPVSEHGTTDTARNGDAA